MNLHRHRRILSCIHSFWKRTFIFTNPTQVILVNDSTRVGFIWTSSSTVSILQYLNMPKICSLLFLTSLTSCVYLYLTRYKGYKLAGQYAQDVRTDIVQCMTHLWCDNFLQNHEACFVSIWVFPNKHQCCEIVSLRDVTILTTRIRNRKWNRRHWDSLLLSLREFFFFNSDRSLCDNNTCVWLWGYRVNQ